MLTEAEAKQIATRVRLELKMLPDTKLTCEDCKDNDSCEYAFDPYNTQGDCLAMK